MKYLRLALLFGLLGWISPAANAGWGIFQDATNASSNCSPPSTSCVTVPSGLVGWWSLDNSELSGTSVTDTSGSGITGTTQNTPTTGVTGEIQQGFTFLASSSQWVDMVGSGSSAVDITGPFTFMAWTNVGTLASGVNEILSKGFDGSNTQYEFFLDSTAGKLNCKIFNGTTHVVLSSSAFTSGVWQHWACTFDGATWQVYLNGSADGSPLTDSTAPPHTAKDFGIGAVTTTGAPGNFFNGSIDDVRVYNRALSGAEITSIYNSGVLGKP